VKILVSEGGLFALQLHRAEDIFFHEASRPFVGPDHSPVKQTEEFFSRA